MSTPSSRKGRRKLGLLAAVAAALGLFLALGGNAAASVGCQYDGNNGQLYVIVSDDNVGADNDVIVKRGANGAILVNGATCFDVTVPANATIANVDQINVIPGPVGADGDDDLTVDQTLGPFGPGFNQSEGSLTSLNEIEWYVDLGEGFNTLTVLGSNAGDGWTAGQDDTGFWDGIVPPVGSGVGGFAPWYTWAPAPLIGDLLVNLNAGFLSDDDADIWVVNYPFTSQWGDIDYATFNLGAGDNVFTAKGGDGTGVAVCSLGIGVNGETTEGFFDIPLSIISGSGNDNIIGSECEDYIVPGGGNDFVDGNGPEESFWDGFQDEVLAEYGLDFFFGDLVDFSNLAGPATITINPDGSLTMTGIPGTFVGIEGVVGTQGNDTINGNNLENVLIGAGGNDTINGNGGDDYVDGDNASGWAWDSGTAGNDTLAGDAQYDMVLGGPGDDLLNENTQVTTPGGTDYGDFPYTNGADALSGGPGVDTIDYGQRTTSIVVYLGLISTFNDGADTNQDGLSNEFDDVYFDTENAITGSGQDIISANFTNNRANNVFTDNGGNDCVEGGPGNDTFETGSAPQGADVMVGNTGTDTANYSGRSGAVAVSLDGVANDGDIATNEGDNVGGFSVSCRPATIIVNPPISAFPFDIENIPSFVDTPIPGPAPQLCFFVMQTGRSAQGIFEEGFCPGEQVGGDAAPLKDVDVENVNGGSGDDQLVGDATGNVLNGNGGNDSISGGASTDQLNGGAGDDRINGGAGNDAIDGGEGTNWADFAGAGAGGVGVQVNLTTGTATGDGNDTLKNIQGVNGSSFADAITGNDQNNFLNGNNGNDAINGAAGDDQINGGSGTDQMKGAAGNDKITGAAGNDSAQGGAGDDNIQGGNGKDTLLGQKGNDKLYGNAQPDFLNGGPGSDVCKPGSPGLARGDVVVNCES